ncbi:MAG: hypothetical protein QME68_08300, partial [Elusimicrobiota bacterium]|nr:hypothetical protein [Elusimicrobiota bacterium]
MTKLIRYSLLLSTFYFLLFTHSYSAFEEREISARVLSMSGVSVGIADDIESVFYNPAGLVNLTHLKLNASDANLYDILKYRFFGLGMPLPTTEKLGVFGFAFEEFGFEKQYKETKVCFS